MEYKIDKICRVCLNEDEKMMSLFKVNVSRKIMACASVQVWPNDELPAQICHKCCAKLHVAFQFKKQCEKSDSKLRTYLGKSNKCKLKENHKISQEVNDQQGRLKNQLENIKDQDVNGQLQQGTLNVQNQDNCLYVECSGRIVDVSVPEQSFIQNNQPMHQGPLDHLGNYTTPQNTLQNSSQMGNYNVQHVIYSTTYPVTMQQPLQQANNLLNNQVVTTLPMLQDQVHHTQPQSSIQQPPVQNVMESKNCNEVAAPSTLIQNKNHSDEKSDNSSQCPICLKVFMNVSKKNRHMKIHSRTDMPYKCIICNKEFMHGGNYKIHMRMHNNERPFSCTVCPKRFIQAQDLEKHVRTHTGERPHKCPMCWKAFSTGSNLIAHIRTHTGERPYVCCVCTKAFCQSNELTKHMRTHTGEKSHRCDICNKGFNGSSTLIVHKRSHTGEKPFVCKICDKSFTQSSCLSAHLKRYGESRYPCDLCNVAFHSEKVLQGHLKNSEHNEKLFKCQTSSKQSDFNEHIMNEHMNSINVDVS